jgi:hypothetical protein
MATLRKRTRRTKNGATQYWIVDFSAMQGSRTRRHQEHFPIDPEEPAKARLQAEARKAEIERQFARAKLNGRPGAIDDGPADVEIADALDRFAKAIQPNCSPEYHKIVVLTLNKFWHLLHDWGIMTTRQFQRQHFADFVAVMREKGNRPKSIHNDLSVLKRAFRWCIDEGYLEPTLIRAFPAVKVPKRKRRALTKDEIETLVKAAEGTPLYVVLSIQGGVRGTAGCAWTALEKAGGTAGGRRPQVGVAVLGAARILGRALEVSPCQLLLGSPTLLGTATSPDVVRLVHGHCRRRNPERRTA